MKIISNVEIIDDNPWWCNDYGTLNHPQPFDNFNPTHVCYPKDWTDGIGKFICDTHQWIILKSEKELTWRCIPFEFWCRHINRYNEYMNYVVICLCYGLLLQACNLIIKGIIFLINRLDPYPGIGPNLPEPAPAGWNCPLHYKMILKTHFLTQWPKFRATLHIWKSGKQTLRTSITTYTPRFSDIPALLWWLLHI